MNRKHILLTIDWDYFVPLKTEYDWGHRETYAFQNHVWAIRAAEFYARGLNPLTEVSTTGEESSFWPWLCEIFDIESVEPSLIVSDSHSFAYSITDIFGHNHIVNFDAHADLGYQGPVKRKSDITCDNWLGHFLKGSIKHKADVVYSTETLESSCYFEDTLKSYQNRAEIHRSKGDFLAALGRRGPRPRNGGRQAVRLPVRTVHICRSGIWTPPWLDDKFEAFIAASGLHPLRLDDLEPRHFSIDDAKKLGEDMRKAFDSFKTRGS